MKTLPRKTVLGLLEDGIDIRDKQLIMVSDSHCTFPRGDLLVLDVDDGTYNPSFRSFISGEAIFVNMDRLAVYDATNPEHVALRTKRRLLGHANNKSQRTY
jgi:hypothetical protein